MTKRKLDSDEDNRQFKKYRKTIITDVVDLNSIFIDYKSFLVQSFWDMRPLVVQSDIWLPVSKCKNYVLKDPLLDWLDLYGDAKVYMRDYDYPEYNKEYDFNHFMRESNKEFKRKMRLYIQKKHKRHYTRITNGNINSANEMTFEKTKQAIKEKVPIIIYGVLYNYEKHLFGIPDLIVHSTYLRKLVNYTDPDLELVDGYYIVQRN